MSNKTLFIGLDTFKLFSTHFVSLLLLYANQLMTSSIRTAISYFPHWVAGSTDHKEPGDASTRKQVIGNAQW